MSIKADKESLAILITRTIKDIKFYEKELINKISDINSSNLIAMELDKLNQKLCFLTYQLENKEEEDFEEDQAWWENEEDDSSLARALRAKAKNEKPK